MQSRLDTPPIDLAKQAVAVAPRIMVWHIRTPATADETLNRVIIPVADREDGQRIELNVGAPVL